MKFALTTSILTLALTAAACASDVAPAPRAAGEPLVQASLLADVSVAEPGKPFKLALLMKMKPGWHVYWKNPGDSGQPPSITWTLPEGVVVDPIIFPVPRKIPGAGGLMTFGYEDEVALLMTVHTPAQSPTATLSLRGQASWLVCSAKSCVPGEAEVAITLPTGAIKAGNEDFFTLWEARQPQNLGPAMSSTPSVTPDPRSDGKSAGGRVDVSILWKGPAPSNLDFFPPPADEFRFDQIRIVPKGASTLVSFNYELLKGRHFSSGTLSGVLAYTLPTGERRGIVVDFALPAVGK